MIVRYNTPDFQGAYSQAGPNPMVPFGIYGGLLGAGTGSLANYLRASFREKNALTHLDRRLYGAGIPAQQRAGILQVAQGGMVDRIQGGGYNIQQALRKVQVSRNLGKKRHLKSRKVLDSLLGARGVPLDVTKKVFSHLDQEALDYAVPNNFSRQARMLAKAISKRKYAGLYGAAAGLLAGGLLGTAGGYAFDKTVLQ